MERDSTSGIPAAKDCLLATHPHLVPFANMRGYLVSRDTKRHHVVSKRVNGGHFYIPRALSNLEDRGILIEANESR